MDIEEVVERVIGAAIEVRRHFGAGFRETTYHRAMEIELRRRDIAFESEVPVVLKYHDEVIGEGRIDLLIDRRLVVELKAASAKPDMFRRQVVSYLKAGGYELGLILNFETELLKHGITRV
ncbi:MAG: GxxExxY protein, partial [Acidobacteriota bacterium]